MGTSCPLTLIEGQGSHLLVRRPSRRKQSRSRDDPGVEEAHSGRQPGPKPCSLPHQCLGLRPTFLHPTFLLLPDESTGGAAPAAGSLRVPHLPAGSIIVGVGRACSSGLPRHLDSAGTQEEEQDKERTGGGSLPPGFPGLVDSKTAGRLQRPYAPTACWIGLTGVHCNSSRW